MSKLSEGFKNFKESLKVFNTENVFTLLFLIGLFAALVGLFWLLWLALVWLFNFSLPLFIFVLGLALMAITYLLSYLRR